MNLSFRWTALGLLCTLAAGCSIPFSLSTSGGPEQVITPTLLKTHIEYLASDRMLGRNTPSPQLDTCAQYIAGDFQADGLTSLNGIRFQPVRMIRVKLGKENSLRLEKHGTATAFTIKTDYVPFECTANCEAAGAVVFAGYGITAPEYNYDDYQRLDVKGKIVVVLRHEPGEDNPNSVFKGKKATEYSGVTKKMGIAVAHGAVGMLVVTDPLNHASLSPRGFPWPSLSRNLPEDALPLSLEIDESSKIPVVHVGEEVIASLFGSVDSLLRVQKRIDDAVHPESYELEAVRGDVQTSTILEHATANNVVGFLEGSDPVLKNEVVIIGGHYDHVGYLKGAPAGTDSIYNGADDNASGASGVLAVARAAGSMKLHPKRSLLFVTYAGEEKGLFGSQWYVDHPLIPLNRIAAVINLDMIGRNAADSIGLIGYTRCPQMDSIAREVNTDLGIQHEFEHFINQSDHASFMNKNIPFIFFNSGDHADLHKVTDSPDKINYDKAARVSRFAFRLAMHIANDDHHYHVTSITHTEKP